MPRGREDLLERLPEAERAIADGELGRDRQATGFQPDQKLPPALGTLAGADLEAEQLLLALVHGVSLRLEVLAGWLPASIRRLPQTVVTQLPP